MKHDEERHFKRTPCMKNIPVDTSLPRWNLNDLYTSPTDPAIDATLTSSLARAQAFAKTYQGTIASANEHTLKEALVEYEAILQEAIKPAIYATLAHSTDSTNEVLGALVQRTEAAFTNITSTVLFFELELKDLPEAPLRAMIEHETLLPYRHYLRRDINWRAHRLDEARETIIRKLQLTGSGAWSRFFDETFARTPFYLPSSKQPKTEEAMLDLLHHPNHNTRKRAAAGFTNGLKKTAHTTTFAINTLIQEKKTTDELYHFATPEASRHLVNETDAQTVQAMCDAIMKRCERVVGRYYHFKRRVLGLRTLHDYDRYAPVGKVSRSIPWNEAKHIVLDAFRGFSPEFADLGAQFFDNGWIDAPQAPGKRGGAYCMFVTPDEHPYVFVNYGGTTKHVLTLAHELGHGIHACLARSQNYLQFDMPLTIAETASVFGEMLTFRSLYEQLSKPKDKLALLMQKIEEVFATVFRQTVMFRFEQEMHALGREKGFIGTDELSALWRKHQTSMFGDSVTLTPSYDLWWSYISHFYHTPFYVYAYAFGELLTLSLYQRYQKHGSAMTAQYLDFLRAGGSRSPQELVAPFGIDLHDASFWEEGLDAVEDLVDEAERLYKK